MPGPADGGESLSSVGSPLASSSASPSRRVQHTAPVAALKLGTSLEEGMNDSVGSHSPESRGAPVKRAAKYAPTASTSKAETQSGPLRPVALALLPVALLTAATVALAVITGTAGSVAVAVGVSVGLGVPALVAAAVAARALVARRTMVASYESAGLAGINTSTGRLSGALSARVASRLGFNIMEAANDAIIVIDSHCQMLAVNARTESLFGHPASALIGQNVKMLMPQKIAVEHDDYIKRYLRSGRAIVAGTIREVEGMSAAGDPIPCELSLSAMRIEGNAFFVGMLRDVRARREAEARIASQRAKAEQAVEKVRAEEYRSRQIMDIANDAVILIDSKCTIVSVNKMTLQMFEIPSETDLIGRNVNMLMPPDIACIHDGLVEKYLSSGRATVAGTIREVYAMRPGKQEQFPAELSMNDVVIGPEHYFVGMLRDITARKSMQEKLDVQMRKTESLLRNMLPEGIARRLMERPKECIADRLDGVAILFADIVEFTPLAGSMDAAKLVELLNRIFTEFDELAEQNGLEKIKTLGDAFMCAAGLPSGGPCGARQAAANMADMALAMHQVIAGYRSNEGKPFRIRIGIHMGTVVAGVIGKKKYLYDLWGDAVNVASRMESSGVPGRTQVTHEVYQHLRDAYVFEDRGKVYVKGKGEMRTYFLVGRATATPRASIAASSFGDLGAPMTPGYNPLEAVGAKRIDSWDFVPSSMAASQFPALFREMLVKLQLVERFRIRERELRAFATAVFASYRQVPYHNAARAIDSAHLMYLLLRRIPHPNDRATPPQDGAAPREGTPAVQPPSSVSFRRGASPPSSAVLPPVQREGTPTDLSPTSASFRRGAGSPPNPTETEPSVHAEGAALFTELERFALMIAALCMDLDHPGVSANFLVASHAPLAMQYCNRSPLEQHHGAKLLTLLEQKAHAVTAGIEPRLRGCLATMAVDCILATDVDGLRQRHGAARAWCQCTPLEDDAGGLLGFLSPAESPRLDKPAANRAAAAALMRCAHFGTSARSFDHAKLWGTLEMQERMEEGRLLAEVGAEVPEGYEATDELDMGVASLQAEVVAAAALPAFEAAAALHPSALEQPLAAVRRNLAEWRALAGSYRQADGGADREKGPSEGA